MRFSRFLQGVKAELPLLVGVAPFGMIYGVLAIQAGIIKIQAQAMSSIIFAGSSQIVFTQLVLESAPGLVIVVAVLVVNLRHALYSAWMAPYLQRLSRGWKLLLAYLLTDEAYVVSAIHYEKLGYADYVIHNDKALEETRKQVEELWQTLRKIQKEKAQ